VTAATPAWGGRGGGSTALGGVGWGSIVKQRQAKKAVPNEEDEDQGWSGIIQAYFCKITFVSSKTHQREYLRLRNWTYFSASLKVIV
jgi:hypothetical protein